MTEFHNDRPAGDSAELEQLLRSLQPNHCDSMLPDTMYQAGWAAASNCQPGGSAGDAAPDIRRPVARRSAARFLTGVACGLLCGVLMSAAWFSDKANQQSLTAESDIGADEVDETPLTSTEAGTNRSADSGTADMTTSSGVPEMLATLFEWDTVAAVNRDRSPADTWTALSPAARSTWHALQQRESSRRNGLTTSDGAQRSARTAGQVLTPFSTQRLVIDDLL